MQLGHYSRLLAGMLLLLLPVSAAVVDRVAIVIDKKVITESEVLDELPRREHDRGVRQARLREPQARADGYRPRTR